MRLRIVKEPSREKERREAYIARHEHAKGGKDALYEQSKDARYRSDIRASKRRRSTRISEIRAQKRAERRRIGRNVLKGAGALASVAVIAFSVGKGLDGLIQEQDRRDDQALTVYKRLTGIDPTKAVVVQADQDSDARSQAPEVTVTSDVYETPGEAQEAVEEIESGDNAEGIDVVTAPVEPSDSYPDGGTEVIQIQQKEN